jgi:hypothetical protein
MNERYKTVRSAFALGLFFVLAACSGPASGPANPFFIPTQSLTFTPQTTAVSPGRVLRGSTGLVASINATSVTHQVLLDNGSALCVTETTSAGSAGFVPGQTTYPFTFVPVAGAPANCTQTVTITVDAIPATFFVIVP